MAAAVKTSGGFCNTQQQWLHSTRDLFLHGSTHSNAKECKSKKAKKPISLRVKATSTKVELDFNDPSWKQNFQEDWDNRFNLPRITDIYDLKPRPTTFSLKKQRTPTGDEDSTPMDMWNGYVNNDDRALMKVIKYSSPTSAGAECIDPDCSWVEQWVHRAGPRKDIYYEPNEVKAAIVTCGGLCPGLNDVIRQVVFTLETYGVKNIVGIPFGFRGFFEKGLKEMPLSRNLVENINLAGGSFLGVSRGGAKTSEIVDSIQARRIDMLFVLGGNGTHAGANAIHDEEDVLEDEVIPLFPDIPA
uniref:Phosphofructokinase domain-containing protein n=1 Tax=Triticum urartu TaxID=4572 RepID=A0A8R7QY50_TRIUA